MRAARILVITMLSFCAANVCRADVIATWTFEVSAPVNSGPHTAEVNNSGGTAQAIGSHAGAATYSSPAGNGSAHSYSSNTWAVGDFYQFSVVGSTASLAGLSVSVDVTSSNTGPRDFKISYSTDGVTYFDLANYVAIANAAPNPVWNATTSSAIYTNTFNFGTIFDSATSAYFRLVNTSTVSANGGTVSSGGTSRVDNFSINTPSTAVPEPFSMLFGALAVSGFGGFRLFRRRGQKTETTVA